MKWLITGAAGFIGTNAALHLGGEGEEVVAVDNFHRPGSRENARVLEERLGLVVEPLEIRYREEVFRFWQKHRDVEVVLHLAAQSSLVASLKDPVYDFETNALGTLNVLEATRHLAPGARVIYASTNKVYGDLSHLRYGETETRYTLPDYPQGLPETLPLSFQGGYSCSKEAADQYVLDYARAFGLKTVSLRQSSVYGGHQRAREDHGWVAYFVRMAVEKKPFRIFGNGKQVRDLLHVDDLLRLYRIIARLPDRSPVFGQAFNVGGGPERSLSLLELFHLLRSRYGHTLRYRSEPPRPADQRVFVADCRRLAALTGWQPRVGLEEGLDRIHTWSLEVYAKCPTVRW